MESQLVNLEWVIAGLLLVAALVAWVSERIRIPYTVGLVFVGVLITVLAPRVETLQPDLARELILFLLLPPLVFDAALHIEFNDFRANWQTVVVLAIAGVLLTTGLVAGFLRIFLDLPWPSLIVFGALISATDPVAVTAIFRQLGISKRLALLVEGESLLNDATAIVVFALALEFALQPAEISVASGLAEFVRVSSVGLVIGLIFGYVFYRIIRQIDDYLIETALSAVLAYGAYLLAERVHASGVLAVVAAGLMIGNRGKQYGMSHTTRNVLINIWEFVTFLANSFVFLLIGLQMDVEVLATDWLPILLAIGAVLAARAVSVYGLNQILNRVGANRVPAAWQTVMWWGGLRGGIALALALTLPDLYGRNVILHMTFGVVLFTLLVQATTMRALLWKLGVLRVGTQQLEYERVRARLAAARSAKDLLASQLQQGLLTHESYDAVAPQLTDEIARLSSQVTEVLGRLPDIRAEELASTQREILQAKRTKLRSLHNDGMITAAVYNELRAEIDAELTGA